MKSSKHCTLCKLVVRSVQDGRGSAAAGDSNHISSNDSAKCTLSWEVDGREVVEIQSDAEHVRDKQQSPRGLTRRIHLRWNQKNLKDSYLVYVASGKRMTASDADRAWNSSLLFLGREIGLRGNIQARVKSWIDLCQDKHQGPCAAPQDGEMEERFFDMVSHSYFGVIDVLNMQLTELPKDKINRRFGDVPQYVALSYVWGTAPAYRTVLGNVMQHRMHGGLDRVFHQLPKVIQDAIDLVRRLGIQFLWIDALCIIQDSARSWKLNAYNMDLIYGNAAFTICAADGPSATTGLRAMHEETGTGSKDQLIADCTDDVRLVVSRPPEMYIKSSRWNTRAWTFQERLLSRRCLIFTGSRVYFQCRSTGMSEDIYADREGAGWSLDFMDAPLQTFRQLPLRSIWVYMKTVELYTARELTKQADILAAFSGVSNLMQQTMQAPFVFGLPTSHFDLALLWEYFQPAQRRRLDSKAAEGEFSDFPSWSWSGWFGAPAHYRRDTIEECLDDVNEWLEDRTWIRWYIRDGNGDLRPLWDQDEWQMDRSEHEKWQGYGNDRSSGSMTFWAKSRSRRSTVITRGTTWPPREYERDDRHDRYIDRAPPRPTPPLSPTLPQDTPRFNFPDTPADPDPFSVTTKHVRHEAHRARVQDAVIESGGTRGRRRHWDIVINGPRDVSPPSRIVYEYDTQDDAHRTMSRPPVMEWQQPLVTPSHPQPHPLFARLGNGGWESTSKIASRWARVAYRNEIIRFLCDVLVALLRLCSVLLGMPVRDIRDGAAGSASRGRVENVPSSRQRSVVTNLNDENGAPTRPFQRSRALSPSPSPPPSQLRRPRAASPRPLSPPPPPSYLPHPSSAASRPLPPRRRSSYAEDEYIYADKDEPVYRSSPRYGHDPRSSPERTTDDLDIHIRPREQRRSSPERDEKDILVVREPPRSALYSEHGRGPRSSRSVKQVRYDDSARSISNVHHQDRSSRTDDRRFHDLVFQPDRKMDPEQTELRPEFRITLKEYPYQPVIAPFEADLGASKVSLMPILQFWTWHTFLHIQCQFPSSSGLVRCAIADKFGDWCGSIMLDAKWVGSAKTAKQEFIAISEAKKFTEEECGTWSYYVPKEREESEWDLFYVLLIAWNDGRWERVGLGKAFKEALRDAVWKEIVLA